MSDLNAGLRALIGQLLAQGERGTAPDVEARARSIALLVDTLGKTPPAEVTEVAASVGDGAALVEVGRTASGATLRASFRENGWAGGEQWCPISVVLDHAACRALGRALLDFAGPEDAR